jgi:aspartyl-tRNA(Asn)/glutamyl-tRNA(Gln) amidotransferase subunit A
MAAERLIPPGQHTPAQTIVDAANAIRRGDTTALALTTACLDRIAAHDKAINAFITVLQDSALRDAEAADAELGGGRDRGLLHGIPISLKDIIDLQGTPTTAASNVRAGHVAVADAPIVRHLRNAGAVIVGKTNLHEFALGTTNEESAFGPVRHPLDESRSPGGSSGGSAASVLANMAYASVGTDTGGSIRIPSAVCGLVGLKASEGDVSAEGVVPLSRTLDHVGPLCRSVTDASLLFHALRGEAARPLDASPSVRGMRVGILREYFAAVLDTQVARQFDLACTTLEQAGAILEEVRLPHAADIATIYLHIVLTEGAAYHAATLESRGEAYTPNVRMRLEVGRAILAEDYVRAMRGREVLRGEVDAALAGRACLALPTLPIVAPQIGVPMVRIAGVDEPVRNVMLRLTQLFNITGHPALTLPCGPTSNDLPVGFQLAGRRQATVELLNTARAIEAHLSPGVSG